MRRKAFSLSRVKFLCNARPLPMKPKCRLSRTNVQHMFLKCDEDLDVTLPVRAWLNKQAIIL